MAYKNLPPGSSWRVDRKLQRDMNLELYGDVEDITPITESVTKTVAADGDPAGVMDFDTFHEAMLWVCASVAAGGKIKLELEDGIHYTGGASAWGISKLYSMTGNDVTIASASGNRDDCTITVPADTPTGYIGLFSIKNGGSLYVSDITTDLTLGGAADVSELGTFNAQYIGTLDLYNVNMKNAGYAPIECFYKSYVFANSCTIDGAAYGVQVQGDGYFYLYQCTISNASGQGVWISRAYGHVNSPTMTDNAEDYSIPLNEIQTDGSYISDRGTPLVMEDSFGTTAERPDPVMDGFNYFDSTLGIPIWYDGTNWVNSVGTTV